MTFSAFALAAAVSASCSVTSPAHTVAVVELYTSQGCSSCPPADRWLSKLEAGDRLVPLALHVGYWDYIGWKDPFARREFNERQRWLAGLNNNRTVYTPGVFVHGKETPRWSDTHGFASAVRAVNAVPAGAQIELSARLDGGAIEARANVKVPGAAQPQVFVALVQGGFSTRVNAGENRGETLTNDHVVREWSGPHASGSVASSRWTLPDTPLPRLSLVALVQDGERGRILQAVSLPLAGCAR